jgi:phthiocerol/phenolphthiocerol synthesis type-I polyketide synthase E
MRQDGNGTANRSANIERRTVLPNNLEIAYQSSNEIHHFYEDIFEKEVYVQHGITLGEGCCVFDVGANIGLFTLFIHQKFRDARIYSFEPAPPLFRILTDNVERHGVNARLFNHGVSDQQKTAEFTFYPRSSGMSSFYPDKNEEQEALRAILLNEKRRGQQEIERIIRDIDDLLEERFRSETFNCRLRPLSDVIREQRVDSIDLLKIDVQKSEVDVLAGLSEEDWPKVKQIVIEVHDIDRRMAQVCDLLQARGYRVETEQDDMYEGSVLYNLYATRFAAAPRPVSQPGLATSQGQPFLGQLEGRAKQQEEAFKRRREVMKRRRSLDE